MEENLFFVAYFIYMVTSILSTSFYYIYFMGTIYKLIVILCICLLIGKELIGNKYALRSIIGLLFVLLVMGIVVVGAGSSVIDSLILTAIFVYCARNIDFREIIRVTIILSFFCLAFVIMSSYMGIIKDYVSYGGDRIRHYLGFRYALQPPAILSNIIAAEVYYEKEKLSYRKMLVMALLNYYLYYMTDSRLTFWLSLLLLCFALLMKYKVGKIIKNKIVGLLMCVSYVMCCLLSFYLVWVYQRPNSMISEINHFLGGRISLASRSLKLFGIPVFGKQIHWVGNGLDAYGKQTLGSYLYVDNVYIQIGQRYGIAILVLYILLFTVILFFLRQRKEYYLMLILAFIALHGIIDDACLQLYYNTFWFVISYLLMHRRHESQKTAMVT